MQWHAGRRGSRRQAKEGKVPLATDYKTDYKASEVSHHEFTVHTFRNLYTIYSVYTLRARIVFPVRLPLPLPLSQSEFSFFFFCQPS
jgi:hypothetical protein